MLVTDLSYAPDQAILGRAGDHMASEVPFVAVLALLGPPLALTITASKRRR